MVQVFNSNMCVILKTEKIFVRVETLDIKIVAESITLLEFILVKLVLGLYDVSEKWLIKMDLLRNDNVTYHKKL